MKDFDKIYEQLQLNHSVELNTLRNKCRKIIIKNNYYILFTIIIPFILEGLNYILTYKNYKIIFYILTIIILIIFIKNIKKSLNNRKIKYPGIEQIKQYKNENITNYITYFKNELIKDLIHNLNENIIYSSENGLKEEIYQKFFEKLDSKKYTKYISEDYIKLDSTWIYDISTYRNETNNIKNEHKIFSGLVSINQTKNNKNFLISSINYKNKTKKTNKYYTYGDINLNQNIINTLNHFVEYTGSKFDILCQNNCILIRAHFNCMFDPNIFLGHMPKKLLYNYYKNLYEYIILINKVTKYLQ